MDKATNITASWLIEKSKDVLSLVPWAEGYQLVYRATCFICERKTTVVCVLSIVLIIYKWLGENKKKEVVSGTLSMVGFGRRTLEQAKDMIEKKIEFTDVKVQTLARDSDLNVEALKGTKVLLVAAFTERNNIMGSPPDVGELSRLYTNLPEDIKEQLMVMYAGVPQSHYERERRKDDVLQPECYGKLWRSQPDLGPLMASSRFMAVTSAYCFNRRQFSVFSEWCRQRY